MTKLQLITITMTIVAVLLCFVFVSINTNDKPTYSPPPSSSTENNNKTDNKQDNKPGVDPEPTTTDLLQLYDITATTDQRLVMSGTYFETHLSVVYPATISDIFRNQDIYDMTLTMELCGTYDSVSSLLNGTPTMTPKTSDIVGRATLENSLPQNDTSTTLTFADPYDLPPKYGTSDYGYGFVYAYTVTIVITNKVANTTTTFVCEEPTLAHYNGNNELGLSQLTLTATQKIN